PLFCVCYHTTAAEKQSLAVRSPTPKARACTIVGGEGPAESISKHSRVLCLHCGTVDAESDSLEGLSTLCQIVPRNQGEAFGVGLGSLSPLKSASLVLSRCYDLCDRPLKSSRLRAERRFS